MNREQLLDRLREADIVHREPVVLRGGEKAKYYVDIKKAYGNPEILRAMGQFILEQIDEDITCIGASGYGGLPLGVAVGQAGELPLTMVRDTAKDHGKKGMIDGYVPTKDDRIAIVDDVFTTGGSLRDTINVLEATGTEIISCHVVVDRSDTSKFKLPVSHLFTLEEITTNR